MMQPFALEFRRKHPVRLAFMQHTPALSTTHGDSHIGAPDSRRRISYLLRGTRVSMDMVGALGTGLQTVCERLGQRRLPVARQMAQFLSVPMFTAVSRYLAPAFTDHPRTPTTGYLFLRSRVPLSDRVSRFLDAGAPPVLFGLGTVTTEESAPVTERVVDAILAAGRRAVILRAAGVPESRWSADQVLQIDFEPFDYLFPRCHLVIHQGGVGTQAVAFVSGVPQLVTSLSVDHRYFGRRAHELGVAPPPVQALAVTSDQIRWAIEFADRPEVRATAARLASLIREEDGVRNAVGFLTHKLGLTSHGAATLQ